MELPPNLQAPDNLTVKRQRLHLYVPSSDVKPPTYERIFGKPPSGAAKDGLYGRAYLRDNYPQQWKVYNMNMVIFRSWMKDDRAAQFLNSNMRHDKAMVKQVKSYLSLRAPELAALTFSNGGTAVTHRMGMEALYRKFNEYKHDKNKHGDRSKDDEDDQPLEQEEILRDDENDEPIAQVF